MEEKKDDIWVTTDNDYFNSGDEAHFYVLKGQAKKLPNPPTKLIEHALEQGVLREATEEEIERPNRT